MATIVAAVASAHSPLMLTSPPADQHRAENVRRALEEGHQIIRRARPDAAIVIAPDHFRTFYYSNMPTFCVGVGTCRGWGDWSLAARDIPVERGLAETLLEACFATGLTPSVSMDLRVDHGLMHSIHYHLPELDVPVVPVLVNCHAPPLAPVALSYRLGEAVRRAGERWAPGKRIVLVASGGLSHWPPIPKLTSTDPADAEMIEIMLRGRRKEDVGQDEARRVQRGQALADRARAMPRINPEWDRAFLQAVTEGRGEQLAAMDTEDIERDAGNGGQEIRSWLTVLGALPGVKGRILAYEPVPEWITGMGVAVLEP